MILRKPYAFLIKHFKKLHLLLLGLAIFIFYKTTTLSSFVSEYLKFFSYDESTEPISNFIDANFYIVIFLIILITGFLIYMLTFKKKPKLVYYFVLITYIGVFVTFMLVNGFFYDIAEQSGSQVALAYSDLLFIFTLPQYLIMLLFLIRTIGLDLKKFGFQKDEEFLAIEHADNEEVEVAVEIDKEKLKRNFKKRLREMKYVYQEYKFIVNIVITVISLTTFGLVALYIYNVTLVYQQGDIIDANGYQIRINESYLTSTNLEQELILEETSNNTFLIMNLTVKNNSSSRKLNADMFRIVNSTNAYEPTFKYDKNFSDLGKGYSSNEMLNGEERTFVLIYEVPKNLEMENFVLYYQDAVTTQDIEIRKIELSITDLEEIEVVDTKKIQEEMTMELTKGQEDNIIIDSYNLNQTVSYYKRECSSGICGITTNYLTATEGYVYLHYTYLSDTLETEELIEYTDERAKLVYISETNEEKTFSINSVYDRTYNGENIYIEVPEEVQRATQITLVYTLRNKEYEYILLGE